MATAKNPMEELAAKRAAAAQAQKEYDELLNATKGATVDSMKQAITDFKIGLSDFGFSLFFADKAAAVAAVKEINHAYEITGIDLGLTAPAPEGSSSSRGSSGPRGPQAAPFKKDGKEIKWAAAAATPPADVQEILDLWKAKKPINEFIALTDDEKRMALIVRIEKNVTKATKEQLADVGYTREEIDTKATKLAKAAAAAKAAK